MWIIHFKILYNIIPTQIHHTNIYWTQLKLKRLVFQTKNEISKPTQVNNIRTFYLYKSQLSIRQ